MRNRIYGLLMGMMAILPLASRAQDNSSLNTFTPYSFYGLGDLQSQGSIATQSMGGIGVGYRDFYQSAFTVNPLNPASYSLIPRQSAALTFGLSGKNTYLESESAKTAHNSFNFNNLGFMLPLGKGVGLALSVNPYSSVGYRALIEETDEEILTDVGHVLYSFRGEGNISQVKAGIGARIFPKLSIGADMIAYLGNISRTATTTITPTSTDTYSSFTQTAREEVSDISFGVGFQYTLWTSKSGQRMLTLGGTYQPKLSLNNLSSMTVSSSRTTDSIRYTERRGTIDIPQRIAAGLYYATARGGIGLDYTYQDWNGAFTVPAVDRVTLSRTQSFHLGFQHTPNAVDIRNRFNRWTYRGGIRYSDMYLVKDGQKINDLAVTVGVGIPLSWVSISEVSVGLEAGRRGKTGFTPHNLPMVRENYFKVSLGFSLFDNNWFRKQRYY
jgi:hypothetical protein